MWTEIVPTKVPKLGDPTRRGTASFQVSVMDASYSTLTSETHERARRGHCYPSGTQARSASRFHFALSGTHEEFRDGHSERRRQPFQDPLKWGRGRDRKPRAEDPSRSVLRLKSAWNLSR